MPAPTAPLPAQAGSPSSGPDHLDALSALPIPADPADATAHESLLDAQETIDAEPMLATDGDTEMAADVEGRPMFAKADDAGPAHRRETRKIPIPPNRFAPLKANWTKIYPPLVNHCHLDVKMNIKDKRVELRTSKSTRNPELIQMGADFVSAFAMGFDVDDCVALLRLDSLYIQTFDIKDVKFSLSADALSRAIGRVAGKDGKTKFAIENATRTRIVIAGSRIHILGAFENIAKARESISSLILGAQPGKVYNNLRIIQSRMKERM